MKRIIVTHHNSDLDALACLVAAQRLYPGAIPVIPTFVSPGVRRYLALHKDHLNVATVSEITGPVDEVIVVDVRDSRRLTDSLEFIKAAKRVIVWDHHPATPFDVECHESHVEPIGACVTLLIEALMPKADEISNSEATLFLLGLYSDTGRLSFASTQPRDARAASWLLSNGANLRVASRYRGLQYSEEQMKLLASLISSVHEESFKRVEIAFCTSEVTSYVDGASDVVQQVMEFGGYDVMISVMRFRKNDRVQVIARSRVSHVDVGSLMREIGGGGHHGAAAATIRHSSIKAVLADLRKVIQANPFQPIRVRDVMAAPVVCIDGSMSLEDAHELLSSNGFTGAPVLRDGKMVGMISLRDIARAERSNKLQLPVSSHMKHQIVTIDPDEPVDDALDVMTDHDFGRLPVVKSGELVGLITRTIVLEHLYLSAKDESDLTIS